MKKISFLALIAAGNCLSLVALPVGNPADPRFYKEGLFFPDPYDACDNECIAPISLRIGFYGDYVFNRFLKVDQGGTDFSSIEQTCVFTNAGLLVLDFCDTLDFFATFGASSFSINTNLLPFFLSGTSSPSRVAIVSDTEFSWSAGGKFVFFEKGRLELGLEGQYFDFQPRVSRFTINATTSFYPDDSIEAHYYEWQIGLGAAYVGQWLAPYVAATYSKSKLTFAQATIDNTTAVFLLRDLDSEKGWGFAVGTSLVMFPTMTLSVEGRFANELALYINGQIRF